MCGRFALKAPPRSIQEHFHLPETPDLSPRYNIAPSQSVAAVRQLPEKNFRQLDMLRWGLIPHWAKDIKIGYKMINARAETLNQKPSFRLAFKKRRCLIAADGFYEWQHSGTAKQPHYIRLNDGEVFAFAGLWESWNSQDGTILESCTIITTAPNEVIGPIHDRMPVIISPEKYDAWLNPATPEDLLAHILQPFEAQKMTSYPVSSFVNNPTNDSADCMQQIY